MADAAQVEVDAVLAFAGAALEVRDAERARVAANRPLALQREVAAAAAVLAAQLEVHFGVIGNENRAVLAAARLAVLAQVAAQLAQTHDYDGNQRGKTEQQAKHRSRFGTNTRPVKG